MAEARLTIALDGEVSLHDYRQTIVHFELLLKALCTRVDRESDVHWDIVGLEAGSATATVEGRSLDRALLAEVIDNYIDIGKRLQRGETLPYPDAITRHAMQLTQVINGRITAVRFLTEEDEAAVDQRTAPLGREGRTYSLGEVRGTVETLQRRRRRSFSLYDELFDQKVICRLRPSQEEMMGQFWGKDVVVTGEIEWDARSGRPVEVRDVYSIEFLPAVPPGSYERARGVWDMGTAEPEILLRRLRDGGEG
jgi:hypothetical protein